MSVFWKWVFTLLLSGLLVLVLWINLGLYHKANLEDGINMDLQKHLKYLKRARKEGASNQMQEIYPEGKVFFESLYGLAWVELLKNGNPNSVLFDQGIDEIDKALNEVSSAESKKMFNPNLALPFGAFYKGWSAYLLGNKISLKAKWSEVEDFKFFCEEISTAIQNSESPYLTSYSGQAWPADMTLCIASLALHDKVFEEKYDSLIQDWLQKVKKRLDMNGLIPHAVNPNSGYPKESARGASQSLVLSLLPSIDSSFAREQYSRFKELFLQKRLGLKAIREYPKLVTGNGDIDSGPVVWGIGFAATIVGQKAALNNQDVELAYQLRNGIEALGFVRESENEKKYLFGILPIGDAFIAWSNAGIIENGKELNWRIGFQIRSFVLMVLIMLLLWRNTYKKG